jgi:hypothetical protein
VKPEFCGHLFCIKQDLSVHALKVFTFFVAWVKNQTKKFKLAPLKLLTNFENPFSNPLQRPYAAILTLKMHTGSRL